MYEQNIEQDSSIMNAIDTFSIAGPVLGGLAGFGIRRTGAYKSALGTARKAAFAQSNWKANVFRTLTNQSGVARGLTRPPVIEMLGLRRSIAKNIAREAVEPFESGALSKLTKAMSMGWNAAGVRGVTHVAGFKGIQKLIAPALARVSTQVVKAGGVATAISIGYGLGKVAASALSYAGQDFSAQEYGIPYIDTQQAFTQRQAAVAAIHNSQLQTRSVFMREAQNFHM